MSIAREKLKHQHETFWFYEPSGPYLERLHVHDFFHRKPHPIGQFFWLTNWILLYRQWMVSILSKSNGYCGMYSACTHIFFLILTALEEENMKKGTKKKGENRVEMISRLACLRPYHCMWHPLTIVLHGIGKWWVVIESAQTA